MPPHRPARPEPARGGAGAGARAAAAALDLREAQGSVSLRVRVSPRASREALSGVRDGALLVRLTASPVEGEANAALVRLLGRALGVPPSAVSLVRGEKGRDKLVRIAGVTVTTVRSRLEEPAEKPSRQLGRRGSV